jgi:hypothetical protein
MDSLPIEIIKYHILYYLYNHDIMSFMLTNKHYYQVYMKDIQENTLLLDRIHRIQACRENHKHISITLDRMYVLYPYHEDSMAIILIKVIHPKDNFNLDVIIRYTDDEWKTVHDEHPCLVDSVDSNDTTESLWLVPLEDTNKLSFALAVKERLKDENYRGRGGKQRGGRARSYSHEPMIWDNNHGWNYCYDGRYHYISSEETFEKSLMEFYHSNHIMYRPQPLYEWVDYSSIIHSKKIY